MNYQLCWVGAVVIEGSKCARDGLSKAILARNTLAIPQGSAFGAGDSRATLPTGLVFGVIVTKKMSMVLLLQIRVLVSACPEEVTEDDLKKASERKAEYKKKTCLPFSAPIAARVYYR